MLAAVAAAEEARLRALVIVAATPRWGDWFLPFWQIADDRARLPAHVAPARSDRADRGGGARVGSAPVRRAGLLHRPDERPRAPASGARGSRDADVRHWPRHAAARDPGGPRCVSGAPAGRASRRGTAWGRLTDQAATTWSVVVSAKWGLERETGIEPAICRLEGRGAWSATAPCSGRRPKRGPVIVSCGTGATERRDDLVTDAPETSDAAGRPD